jgi:hypothetical protein
MTLRLRQWAAEQTDQTKADETKEERKKMMGEKRTTNDKARPSDDSYGLGAWGNERFVVGHVPEINGSEACEVPEFVPTRHELIEVAKYWLHRLLDNRLWFFETGQSGSSEWRTNVYANRRINRIAEILPEQELNQAIEEVERDFKQDKKISDNDWNIFKNGTMEQWRSFQENFWREVNTQNSETPAPEGKVYLNK